MSGGVQVHWWVVCQLLNNNSTTSVSTGLSRKMWSSRVQQLYINLEEKNMLTVYYIVNQIQSKQNCVTNDETDGRVVGEYLVLKGT